MANNFIAHGKNKRSGTRKRGRFVSPANPQRRTIGNILLARDA